MEENEKVEGVTPTTDAAASRLVPPRTFCVLTYSKGRVQKYENSCLPNV